MTKVYIGKLLDGVSYLPVLFPNLGPIRDDRHLFADKGWRTFTTPVFDIVERPEEADFILLPYDYFSMFDRNRSVVDDYIALAKRSGKKLLIFDLSDYTERPVDTENAVIFRVAGYRHHLKRNEIIMPYFVEDLSREGEVYWRTKGDKPVVGFCGWADFKNGTQKAKAYVKKWYFAVLYALAGDKDVGAHQQGLLFRRKLIRVLMDSAAVKTNFIIRKAYGSHRDTIELPPDEARKQYIQNILDSDLTVSIRGDANASQRFYEVLSLGRIPVLLDTDCVLPLEDEIRYDEFMLRIPHRDIDRAGDIIAEFYGKLPPEDFKKMQQRAQEVFENYLRADSFFGHVLPKLSGL
ncbi:exostosin family protein [Patescibacteria group bacterium]|nr:exostosin family protein [Patescibacteria group bacterium]